VIDLTDKFSVDDILSEYNARKNGKGPDENEIVDFSDNISSAEEDSGDMNDIYFGSQDSEASQDIPEDSGEDEDEYTPRRASDFDAEAAETAARAEKAAEKIKGLSGKVRSGRRQKDSPVNRPSVKDIDLELTGKIIPEETEDTVIPDDADLAEKSAALHESRKKKVEEFVLDTSAAENPGSEKDEKIVSGQKEFESYSEATRIQNDILQVKSNLFLRLCVLLFTGIFSLLITIANDLELPLIKTFDRAVSPSAYLFTNTILGLIALGVSYTVMMSGMKNMFKRRPDCDSIAAIGIFVTVISGIVTLFEPESLREGYYHVYICAAIIGLIFNTLGKMMIVQRTEKNFRYVAGEFDRYAVKITDEDAAVNFAKGADVPPAATAVMQKTEFVDDFMKNSYEPDISDEFAGKISPFILIAGIAVALLSLIFDKGASNAAEKCFVALAAFSGTVTLCSSFSLMLAVNVPINRASNKLLQSSSVMLGYSAADKYSEVGSVLVNAEQLFPKESVELINLKLLSGTSLEECILMAASLSCQADSVLKNPFYRILKGKTEMLYPVESYVFEDGLGLSGWINNKRVLLGTRRHMENHSVDGLPSVAKENEYGGNNIVLYLSVSGIMSTMFVIRVSAAISVKKWLQELESEGVSVLVRNVDGFLSENFIAELFDLDNDTVRILPFRCHKEYADQTEYTGRVSSSMLCGGHFTSFAMLIVAAKRIKASAQFGVTIQLGAVILGAVIAAVSMILGSFSQITPSVVVAYNIAFAAVSLLVLNGKKII